MLALGNEIRTAGTRCEKGARDIFPPGRSQGKNGPLGAGACGSEPACAGSDRRQRRSVSRAAACKASRSTRGDKRGSNIFPGRSGFTLIELLLVLAIIAMAGAGVVSALRDSGQTQLERDAQRLVALLESARAQSRTMGSPVYWRASELGYEFIGLPAGITAIAPAAQGTALAEQPAITAWLAEGVSVRSSAWVTLGPEPIIEPRQIELLLADQSLRIETDGLHAFAIRAAGTGDVTGVTQ